VSPRALGALKITPRGGDTASWSAWSLRLQRAVITSARTPGNVAWYGGGRRDVETVSGTGWWYQAASLLSVAPSIAAELARRVVLAVAAAALPPFGQCHYQIALAGDASVGQDYV
jgi:hypothetical protein